MKSLPKFGHLFGAQRNFVIAKAGGGGRIYWLIFLWWNLPPDFGKKKGTVEMVCKIQKRN